MKTTTTIGRIIGVLTIGTLFGATIGILFAQKKGSKTRDEIFKGTRKAVKKLKNSIIEEVNGIQKKTNKAENFATDKIDEVKEKIENNKKNS